MRTRLRRPASARCDGCLETVQLRHLHVHQHQVGAGAVLGEDRLLAVARLADDFESFSASRISRNPLARCLVVGENDPDRHSVLPFNGKLAFTAKPPCGATQRAGGPRGGRPARACPSARGRRPCSAAGRPHGCRRRALRSRAPSPRIATRTVAAVPPECLTALVSASWTTRYADTSSVRGRGLRSPSTEARRPVLLFCLGNELGELSRDPAAAPARRAGPLGAGSRADLCSSTTPGGWRSRSTRDFRGLVGARGPMTRRAAPAWTPITLTWWATTSCSSRAIRTRSSSTARRASPPARAAARSPVRPVRAGVPARANRGPSTNGKARRARCTRGKSPG